MTPLLTINHITLQQGQRLLCQNLNLSIHSHEAWLILGMNGSGKSTLLSTVAGWHPATTGNIMLQGQPLSDWTARQRAQTMAWLSQHDEHPFQLSVLEKVLTGCQPRLSRWQWESDADVRLASELLSRLDLTDFEHRDLGTLSGGECRRVSLATILMQQAPLMLLDEPLSQLDIHHQQQTLALLAQQRKLGHSLLMVSHDPNHAHALATHVLFLFGEGQWLAGTREEMMTTDNLSRVYQQAFTALTDNTGTQWFVPCHRQSQFQNG